MADTIINMKKIKMFWFLLNMLILYNVAIAILLGPSHIKLAYLNDLWWPQGIQDLRLFKIMVLIG